MIGAFLVAVAAGAASPETGNANVDAFVADIIAQRRDSAISRVYEMNSISGEPNAVTTSEEFVEALMQCTYVSTERRRMGFELYDLRWNCRDGEYFSLLDPNYRSPRLVVGEFVGAATRRERGERWRNAAPPPISRPSGGTK